MTVTVAGILLGTALVGYLLRETNSPLARLLCLAAAATVTVTLLTAYADTVSEVGTLFDGAWLGDGAKILLKAVGVSLLCETVGDMLRDLGENACASRVALCGKLEILALALPLVRSLLAMLSEVAA